ncbi:MATE family efflux transporter [Caldicoprobacter faecalis]|uniref:Probable multidrug resistance protein NorM n=1 Tax=Caldicoprobacter faecalis TaxID=937334 RepID=A0A1I5UHZ5_9FIRM|nr:MATE family efflux transporter [Caldicoprobacter faecalis]SFP94667.1 putative efflux protein, MATE family [Caldicoprobacter faecalis]
MNIKLGNLTLKHRTREPRKPVQLAIELVEPGDLDSCEQPERVTKHLPPGITSKMLYQDIIRIAWPAFTEFILTQLASMVDMMMVGQLGPWAIAAVGLTNQPKFLLMTMFMAMNVGATALIARYKGEGDQRKANIVLRQALLLTFVLSAISSAIGFIFSEPMVRFMGAADEQTLAGGTVYLKIQMVGFVVLALTSTITAALRGIGDSRTAMIYNLAANVVNVIFNYMLIYGHFGFPRMEVAGASIATVIGQCVAFVLAMLSVLRGNRYLRLSFKDDFRPKWDIMKNIFKIGIPAMVEQLVMRAGMIAYSKTVASLGTVAFATHNVCMNIQSMSFMNGQAFGVSATSLTGQSLGKRRPDMAQAYSRYTRRMGMMVSLLLALAFVLFGKEIVKLYTDDKTVIEEGARILKLVAIMQPFQSSQLILAGALRGAGDTRATAIIIFITVLLVRPGLAMFTIRVLKWGLIGAWIALMADQFLRSFLVLMRFNSGKWKTIKV